MAAIVRILDALTEWSGRSLAWLAVAMVLLQGVVVFMRYVFGLSVLWMQESILYLHAMIFLCAAGYTLLHQAHVRVDVLYGPASERTKAKIDIAGILVLLAPVCSLILWYGWSYVAASWRVLEGSIEPSGIPAVYLLKTCILLFAATLVLAGLSHLLRCILVLRGERDYVSSQSIQDNTP
ncbi:TRAP transporter small permease subunit [Ahrensia sp. R2A130]|uniref:TRAP transporter small permease subunit n=1 Tax=Ahrensia sp. R2A130 TaxID=744979 RepID=UPI0001E0F128|nr:TRAP transporter small permease subunit [Ahrensia sp. R2A130]EFL87510.1 tripartite ATP-independent periplasmic transporter DctQ [Ahrensia sp. R2A130]